MIQDSVSVFATARLWDLASGKRVSVLEDEAAGQATMKKVGPSHGPADRQFHAQSDNGTVVDIILTTDGESRKVGEVFILPPFSAQHIHVSHDGKNMACFDENSARFLRYKLT